MKSIRIVAPKNEDIEAVAKNEGLKKPAKFIIMPTKEELHRIIF